MSIFSKFVNIYLAIALIWNTTPVYADHDGTEGTHLPDPSSVNVTEGTASVAKEGNKMTVTTETERAILEWLRGLGVAENEILEFLQPSSSSVVLNRIFSGSPSYILGQLISNGQVFLINSSGIIFGRESSVNVGGLIASALDIADEDFLSGNYHFSRGQGVNPAMVINEGDIRVTEGGPVALIGGAVKNSGTIDAYLGSIALAAGDQVTVSFTPDQLISVVVDEGTSQEVLAPNGEAIASLVENSGTLKAEKISLKTKQVLDIFDQAVNQTGIIEARGVTVGESVVELWGDGGSVVIDGTIDSDGTVSIRGEGIWILGGGHIVGEEVLIEQASESNKMIPIPIDVGPILIPVNPELPGGEIVIPTPVPDNPVPRDPLPLPKDPLPPIDDQPIGIGPILIPVNPFPPIDNQPIVIGPTPILIPVNPLPPIGSEGVGAVFITVESRVEKVEEKKEEVINSEERQQGMAELAKGIPVQHSLTEGILIPQAEIVVPAQDQQVVAIDPSLSQDSNSTLAFNSQGLSLDD